MYVYLAGLADCQTGATPKIDIAEARQILRLRTQTYERAIHRLRVHGFVYDTEMSNVYYLLDVRHCYEVFMHHRDAISKVFHLAIFEKKYIIMRTSLGRVSQPRRLWCGRYRNRLTSGTVLDRTP